MFEREAPPPVDRTPSTHQIIIISMRNRSFWWPHLSAAPTHTCNQKLSLLPAHARAQYR